MENDLYKNTTLTIYTLYCKLEEAKTIFLKWKAIPLFISRLLYTLQVFAYPSQIQMRCSSFSCSSIPTRQSVWFIFLETEWEACFSLKSD